MANPANPYIAGAPLRGERGFFGRQDTLAWVQRELGNPATNALVLFGQRRIGKTSLLLQLQRTLEGPAYLPVYFDLQDQATRPLNQVLYDLTDTIADKLGMERPVAGNFDPRGVYFRKVVLTQIHELLGENRRLVLLMDEFDVLDQAAQAELPDYAAANGFFPFLRRIMTDDARPAFVFVVGRRAEDLALNFTATFKASLVREIWTLDHASAAALVRQAEDNQTLDFTEAAIDRILSFTNSHPYLTQLLCQRIWERAYTVRPTAPPVIDVPQVESIVVDALQAGNQALTWLWNGLSPAERIFAAALAENTAEGGVIKVDDIVQVLSANAERLITREVEAARGDLVKRHVLIEVSSGEYRFAVELFRRWVRQHRPLRDVKDELDRVNPEADQLFNFGYRYFRRREWVYAERYFRDALRENPKHFRARLFLGEALLELHKKDEAVTELQQAYDLDRDEARLPLARGLREQALAREQAGDDDGALLAIDRALQILPTEQAAKDMRARLWAKRADTALAQDDLDKALAAYHEAGLVDRVAHVEALQKRKALNAIETRATTQALNKNWRDAADAYDQLVAQAPDEKSRTQWGSARALAVEEQELQDLFEDGLEAYNAKQWANAQKALAEVVKRRPTYARNDQPAARLLKRVEIELDRPRQMRQIYVTARKWVGVALVGVLVVSLMLVVPNLIPGAGQLTETLPDGTPIAVLTLSAQPPTTHIVATDTPEPTKTPNVTDTPTIEPTTSDTPEPTPTMRVGLEGTALPDVAEGISSDTVSQVTQLARWGGRGAITNVAYSANGALAVASTIGVYLYHPETLTATHFLNTGMSVDSLAFSANGERLAVASLSSDTVQVWRVSDGAQLDSLPGHAGGVLALAFSPDNITLAVSTGAGQILFWDFERVETNRETLAAGVMTSLAFSPVLESALFASGSAAGEVLVWGSGNDKPLQTLTGHNAGTAVLSLAFSPDGIRLASGGTGTDGDANIFMWEVASGINLWSDHNEVESEVLSVAFSPDTTFLAVGSAGGVELRRAVDGDLVWPDPIQDQSGHIHLAFISDAQNSGLVTAASDGTVKLRKVDTGETITTLDSFSGVVRSLAVAPSGQLILAGYENSLVRILETGRGLSRSTFSLDAGPIYSLAIAPDEERFAVGLYLRAKVLGLDGSPGGEIDHNAEVWQVTFSSDGQFIASASEDSTVQIWEWANPSSSPVVVDGAGDAPATSVAFSADASLVLVGYADGTADVWRWAEPATALAAKLLQPRLSPVSLCTLGESLGQGGSRIVAVTFSAADTLALALSESGALYQCDWTRSEVLRPIQLEGNPFTLRTAAFSPDRQMIAGGFGDSTITIWGLTDGTLQAELFGHTAAINAIAFWPDTSRLISASADGTVRVWGVRP